MRIYDPDISFKAFSLSFFSFFSLLVEVRPRTFFDIQIGRIGLIFFSSFFF